MNLTRISFCLHLHMIGSLTYVMMVSALVCCSLDTGALSSWVVVVAGNSMRLPLCSLARVRPQLVGQDFQPCKAFGNRKHKMLRGALE
jgi:hypothetical protein